MNNQMKGVIITGIFMIIVTIIGLVPNIIHPTPSDNIATNTTNSHPSLSADSSISLRSSQAPTISAIGSNNSPITIITAQNLQSSVANTSNTMPIRYEPDTPVTITIKSPTNGSNVGSVQTIQGIASAIPTGFQMWIILYAHEPTNRYYPQRSKIIPDRSGEWSLRDINIGTSNNAGYKFDIIALLANKYAQKEFENYFYRSNVAGSWSGMEQLPDGTKVYDTVTVTRA